MIYKKREYSLYQIPCTVLVTIVYEGELRVEKNCISCIN